MLNMLSCISDNFPDLLTLIGDPKKVLEVLTVLSIEKARHKNDKMMGTIWLLAVAEDLLPMLLRLREDDQGGGPHLDQGGGPHVNGQGSGLHLKALLRAPHLKGP